MTVAPREQLPTVRGRQTQAAIDSAARAVIARKGILATTISDIAAEAGRSTASFYNYYDSKEAMVHDWGSRDATFVEKEGDVTVNRCDGIASLGAAQLNNEEGWLVQKFARSLGADRLRLGQELLDLRQSLADRRGLVVGLELGGLLCELLLHRLRGLYLLVVARGLDVSGGARGWIV